VSLAVPRGVVWSRDAQAQIDREMVTRSTNKLTTYFPDCAPTCRPDSLQHRHHVTETGQQRYCRSLYPKHVAFMAASAEHREIGIIAGNRTGKSDLGAYILTVHMTGLYPEWWTGRRFDKPVSVWAAGDTGKTTRNIIQRKLLGDVGQPMGTGFIPRHLIVGEPRRKTGVTDAYEMIWVRHVPTGLMSVADLKSYDQRREGFQGTSQDVIWLDEEPPEDVYSECLLRTTATGPFQGGIMLLTFTPLQGRTPLVRQFLSEAVRP